MRLTDVIKEYAEDRGFNFEDCEANDVEGSEYAERIWYANNGDIILYLAQLYDTDHPEELTLEVIPRDAELVKESMRLDSNKTGRTYFELHWEKGNSLYIKKIGDFPEPTNLKPKDALKSAKLILDLSLSKYNAEK